MVYKIVYSSSIFQLSVVGLQFIYKCNVCYTNDEISTK